MVVQLRRKLSVDLTSLIIRGVERERHTIELLERSLEDYECPSSEKLGADTKGAESRRQNEPSVAMFQILSSCGGKVFHFKLFRSLETCGSRDTYVAVFGIE